MGLQRGGAVRTHDPEILNPVVVRNAIDVIEDKGHPAAMPVLVLAAEFTAQLEKSARDQSLLEVAAVVGRALDKDLF
jgi:hypothetical protein